MSEKKPKPHNPERFEAILLEIQSTAVAIMTTGRELVDLEQKMQRLQRERDELRGGQKLFTLTELDD